LSPVTGQPRPAPFEPEDLELYFAFLKTHAALNGTTSAATSAVHRSVEESMIYRGVVALLFVAATSAVCQMAQGGLSNEELLTIRAAYAKLNGQTFALHGNPELGRAYDESPERVTAIRKDLLGMVRRRQ
jgi:hypothetical protein